MRWRCSDGMCGAADCARCGDPSGEAIRDRADEIRGEILGRSEGEPYHQDLLASEDELYALAHKCAVRAWERRNET